MCVFDIILKLKIKKFQKVPGMKKSLKEVVSVGDSFFFASEDKRENERWKKTCIVTKVGNKFFFVNKGYGDDVKCELIDNDFLEKQGIIVKVSSNVGAGIYGYKNEEVYNKKNEFKKLSIQLKQINFFESLPEELQEELYQKLKNYL